MLLGICIGLQMLFERGEEGDALGLGLFAGEVPRFRAAGLKIPHMGWNEVAQPRRMRSGPTSPTAAASTFVHSYYPAPRDVALTAATMVYGRAFTCAIARDNIFAVQFHLPKKPVRRPATPLQLVRWRA